MNNEKIIEDTINAIRKNLVENSQENLYLKIEIKKITHISDLTLKDIFSNTEPEQLKEFLAEYNFNHSESFETFIQTNNRDYLVSQIFLGIIN